MLQRIEALIPVKSLDLCKSRLSPILDNNKRAELQLELLDGVVRAIRKSRLISSFSLVTTDMHVTQYGMKAGSRNIIKPTREGLNNAVSQGCKKLAVGGATHQLVLPADLPLLTAEACDDLILEAVEGENFAIAPDFIEDGTNALFFPSQYIPRFCFGLGSYKKHLTQLPKNCSRVKRIEFSLDIDTPADLNQLNTQTNTRGMTKWMA